MSAQITVTQDDEIAIVKVVGQPTVQDILDVNKGFAEAGEIVDKRLWDFRESRVNFSMAELENIAVLSSQLGQYPYKTAILAGSDLTYGLSRMYQVFRESNQAAVAVFRDEGAAMHWLLAD